MFRPLVIIPLYNHAKTLAAVTEGVRQYFEDILVVDDGSTDNAASVLESLSVPVLSHAVNTGKGTAIKDGAAYARQNGFTHILTIDADGQHFPEDLAGLAAKAKENPFSIIIGCRDFNTENVPGLSRFGRKFSAFWARVQTGKKISDTQSGLRAYPVMIFDCLRLRETRYSFEEEVLVKAVWAGFGVGEIPARVRYFEKQERVSHFKKFADGFRGTSLNTRLTLRALLPIPHKRFVVGDDDKPVSVNPFKAVKEEMKRRENPRLLGLSAAWSVFWGSLGLPGVRTLCLLTGIGYFNLNRPVALTMDKLALPPFIPAVCIEAGYFIRHGEWLTEFSLTTLGYQAGERLLEYVLGSLVVAPAFALIVGLIVYSIGLLIRKGMTLHDG